MSVLFLSKSVNTIGMLVGSCKQLRNTELCHFSCDHFLRETTRELIVIETAAPLRIHGLKSSQFLLSQTLVSQDLYVLVVSQCSKTIELRISRFVLRQCLAGPPGN